MSDKFKISWDDLKTKNIDDKIKQQEMLDRARIHQEQVMRNAPPLPGGMPPPLPGTNAAGSAQTGSGSIWMKSVVYLAFFGLIGGLLAWGTGELAMRIGSKEQKEVMEYNYFIDALKSKEIGQYRAEIIIEERASENPYFYARKNAKDNDDFEKRIAPLLDKLKSLTTIQNALFYGAVAFLIAAFLAMAEPMVSKNWKSAATNAGLGGGIGCVAGLLLSLFADSLYRALGAGGDLPTQMFARTIIWGLIGMFLALAPGILLRSWKKLLTGLAGGFAGGLLGGLLFDPICMMGGSDVLSRFVGIVGIGVLSGVGIGILENALKSGWLKVLVGPIKGKQFILYRNPTRIGSSPQSEIYLFKDPAISPSHAAISMSGGGFTIENIGSGSTYVNGAPVTKKKLASGDEIAIGSTRLLFEGKA